MAVQTFDEMYAGLTPEERKVFDNAIARNPELKAGWLRQDDYSRKMNEVQGQKKEFEELRDYKARMEPWADKAYELTERLQGSGVIDAEGNELWSDQKAQLEKDLQAAREAAIAGGEMKPEELEKHVREIVKATGMTLTRDEIAALYQAESKKAFEEGWKSKEAEFNSKTIPFVAGFSAGVAVVASKYEKETGEAWTAEKQQELFDLMGKENNFDPFKVQEKLLAPIREKKNREAEIKAEAEKLARQMVADRMPGGGGEDFIPQPGQPKGALQMALEASQNGGDIESQIKARAVEAAKALQQEGKF